MAPIVDWNKKCENYYKFEDMNVMAFQDLLVLTFENCSEIYNYFNAICINQIRKRPLEIGWKKWKYMILLCSWTKT
jgi:hypothetical protein